MSASSLPASRSPDISRIAAGAAPALVIGLILLGLIFRAEAAAAYQVWNDSTAYSHCFFVLPISLYLAWDRRQNLAGLQVAPLPWMGLLAIPGVVAWMAAERLGIMEGRQLVAMSFVQLLFLAVLGWRVWWAMSAPLLYLYFMVPFGAFLTPVLQKITLEFSLIGLQAIGIPFYADEFLIDTPSGRYFVAEACAGLRFLIASIAFGVLYSLLIYRSYTRRGLFMLASIVIPIVANGFRALGIILLGEVLGSAEAAAADHVLYGWMFFSIVILLLILAGMPFREDHEAEATAGEGPMVAAGGWGTQIRAGLATVLVVAFAGSAAATSSWLDGRAAPVVGTSAPALQAAAGCRSAGPAVSQPQGSRSVENFSCGPLTLSVTVQAFSTRTNPAAIGTARRELSREGATDEMEVGSIAVPDGDIGSWRLVIGNNPATMTATRLWIDGRPSRGGLGERIQQARSSIEGARAAPVLVAVALQFPGGTLSIAERERAQRLLTAFLVAQTGLGAQISAMARAAAGG